MVARGVTFPAAKCGGATGNHRCRKKDSRVQQENQRNGAKRDRACEILEGGKGKQLPDGGKGQGVTGWLEGSDANQKGQMCI